MSWSSVSGRSFFYEKMTARISQKQNSKAKAAGDFPGNMKGITGREEEALAKGEEGGGKRCVQADYSYAGAATALRIRQDGRVNMEAVLECALRKISYSESDYVKAYAAEGYTLKAQVKADEHMVYIEQKNEDGSVRAYEVNPLLVREDTDDPIEQTAVKAWEQTKELFNGGLFTEIKKQTDTKEDDGTKEAKTFAKALEEFHAYVKKRIKEGPPKIQTGGAEFSQKDWERLLRKIDKAIDAYKEELRERLRKLKEESAKNRAAGSATEEKSLEEVAEGDTDDGQANGTGIPETEAIKGTKEPALRGTGFLARLSGEKKAPYSYLADETGTIVYKGVVFICDDKKQQICLGDMSNSSKVLNIPLTKGGVLRVNRDNLDDLVKAIDMFSPEDIARILRAIAQDKKVQNMELEIEDLKSKGPVGAAQGTS